MKIVFILPGRGASGGVRVTAIAANHLINRGHDVRILYRNQPINVRNVYRLMETKLIYRKSPDWIKGFNGKIDNFRKITECKFYEDEIIVGIGMWASSQLVYLNSFNNPKAQYIHGATPWEPDLMKKALSLPYPKIVVASYLKPIVESYLRGKVSAIIHNGIDQTVYFQCVDDSKKTGIGVIYSSHPAKDPETVINVIQKLRRYKPTLPVRVFSIEKRPKQLKEIEYWTRPSIEKAREIYSRSLVWIVASRSEGFSVPVLEAMACGCAVVATDCGGTRDIICDGVNGFLVEVGNVDQIVDRVLLLLDNKKLRENISLKAKETVKKFTWTNTVDKLEKVFRKLI